MSLELFQVLDTCFISLLFSIRRESQFFGNVIKQGISHQLYQLTKIKEVPFVSITTAQIEKYILNGNSLFVLD